jgi:hypothetical protein
MGRAAPSPRTIRPETIFQSAKVNTRVLSANFSWRHYVYIAEFCDSRPKIFMLLGQCHDSITVMVMILVNQIQCLFTWLLNSPKPNVGMNQGANKTKTRSYIRVKGEQSKFYNLDPNKINAIRPTNMLRKMYYKIYKN